MPGSSHDSACQRQCSSARRAGSHSACGARLLAFACLTLVAPCAFSNATRADESEKPVVLDADNPEADVVDDEATSDEAYAANDRRDDDRPPRRPGRGPRDFRGPPDGPRGWGRPPRTSDDGPPPRRDWRPDGDRPVPRDFGDDRRGPRGPRPGFDGGPRPDFGRRFEGDQAEFASRGPGGYGPGGHYGPGGRRGPGGWRHAGHYGPGGTSHEMLRMLHELRHEVARLRHEIESLRAERSAGPGPRGERRGGPSGGFRPDFRGGPRPGAGPRDEPRDDRRDGPGREGPRRGEAPDDRRPQARPQGPADDGPPPRTGAVDDVEPAEQVGQNAAPAVEQPAEEAPAQTGAN